MIKDLKHIEQTVLLDLLRNPSIWNTLDVNYHHPRVERLWTQIADSRLMLHIIHPCETSEALYHPHPWPSAMHVLSGAYEMGLGIRDNEEIISDPLSALKMLDRKDDNGNSIVIREISKIEMNGNNYYEMLDRLGWHYVRPINGLCVSLMLIDKPWDSTDDQDIPKSWGKLPLLTEERKLQILEIFKIRLFYPLD